MAFRRACVMLIALVTASLLAFLLFKVLAPGGWTVPKLVMAAAFIGTTPWTGLCLANGLTGFITLMVSRNPVGVVFPETVGSDPPLPRTVIAVAVRNEDLRHVLPPLRRLLNELDLAGAGEAFSL